MTVPTDGAEASGCLQFWRVGLLVVFVLYESFHILTIKESEGTFDVPVSAHTGIAPPPQPVHARTRPP